MSGHFSNWQSEKKINRELVLFENTKIKAHKKNSSSKCVHERASNNLLYKMNYAHITSEIHVFGTRPRSRTTISIHFYSID